MAEFEDQDSGAVALEEAYEQRKAACEFALANGLPDMDMSSWVPIIAELKAGKLPDSEQKLDEIKRLIDANIELADQIKAGNIPEGSLFGSLTSMPAPAKRERAGRWIRRKRR